jgi:hypothetical protein
LSFDSTDTTTQNWGNAFRGLGWVSAGEYSVYSSGLVNGAIILVFETYTPE